MEFDSVLSTVKAINEKDAEKIGEEIVSVRIKMIMIVRYLYSANTENLFTGSLHTISTSIQVKNKQSVVKLVILTEIVFTLI